MPGPTTESLDGDVKELRGDIHAVAIDLAGLKAEVGIFKWLLGLTLVATLSGLASSVWWAGATNSRLGTLEAQAAERGRATDARLDRIEAAIAKAIAKAEPKGAPASR